MEVLTCRIRLKIDSCVEKWKNWIIYIKHIGHYLCFPYPNLDCVLFVYVVLFFSFFLHFIVKQVRQPDNDASKHFWPTNGLMDRYDPKSSGIAKLFIGNHISVTPWRTDQRMDKRTDKASDRDAWTMKDNDKKVLGEVLTSYTTQSPAQRVKHASAKCPTFPTQSFGCQYQ